MGKVASSLLMPSTLFIARPTCGFNHDFALKFVHADADAWRFQTEGRAVAAHLNIVSVLNVAAGCQVTELVDGNPLRKLKPTQGEAIDYAAHIADAHAGITHRDLKPDNVMVTREGCVKILDFGLARP